MYLEAGFRIFGGESIVELSDNAGGEAQNAHHAIFQSFAAEAPLLAESQGLDWVFTQHKAQCIGIMHGNIEDHTAARIGPFNTPPLQMRRQINRMENPRTQHFADPATGNGITHGTVACGIAQVMIGTRNHARLANRFQHLVRVRKRQCQWLFAENMLTCFGGSNRLITMQFIGGGDINSVDFRIG